MDALSVPRFLLSGTSSGVGKTLLAVGLAHEFRRQGIGLACCIIGPALGQSILFRRLSGRYVRSLDSSLLTQEQNLLAISQASIGANLVMFVGNGGLYDGEEGSLNGSDAEFAALGRIPTILVANAESYGASISALVKGFIDSAHGFNVVGSILNRVSSLESLPERAGYLQRALEHRGLPAPLGIVPSLEGEVRMPSQYVSEAVNETSLPRQFFIDAAHLVAEHIDLEALVAASRIAPSVKLPIFDQRSFPRRVRIAVSDDGCFNLCYQDNLDLLRHYGAEIVTFSPLADTSLPSRIGGIYITGAYLSEYAAELEANEGMRSSILDFMSSGGVLYSEGAGTAYLCRSFENPSTGEEVRGVGALPGKACFTTGTGGEYVKVKTEEDTILGPMETTFKGMSTGEWEMKEQEQLLKTIKVEKKGKTAISEGFSPGAQVFCTFNFPHLGSAPEVAKSIVDAAEVFRKI